MTRVTPARFPALRRVLTGYLHEDALADGGTPEAALQLFWSDAAPAERRQFQREVRQFLARTAAWDLDEIRDLLWQLGCRWIPPTRRALTEVLTDAATQREP